VGRPSKYPPEFRREAVELVKTSERPRVEIARSLGISDNTLANWIAADREVQARSDDPNGLSETEREELRRLRKENIELRTDRKILRKAAAYFARGDAAVSRFRFVHDHRDTYQVKRLCQLVEGIPVGLLPAPTTPRHSPRARPDQPRLLRPAAQPAVGGRHHRVPHR
jgi:transposase